MTNDQKPMSKECPKNPISNRDAKQLAKALGIEPWSLGIPWSLEGLRFGLSIRRSQG
jgi:hypothetical protein